MAAVRVEAGGMGRADARWWFAVAAAPVLGVLGIRLMVYGTHRYEALPFASCDPDDWPASIWAALLGSPVVSLAAAVVAVWAARAADGRPVLRAAAAVASCVSVCLALLEVLGFLLVLDGEFLCTGNTGPAGAGF